MNRKKSKSVSPGTVSDAMIARILLPEQQIQGEGCPGDDTLAAFIEGRLTSPERDAITIHLEQCRTCYEVYSAALRTESMMAAADTPRMKDRSTRGFRLLAMAAVLALAVAAFLVWNPFHRPGAELNLAQKRLQLLGDPGKLSRGPIGHRTSYAFAPGLSRESAAFLSGITMVDLEVAARSKDLEQVRDFCDLLTLLTGSLEKSQKATGRFQTPAVLSGELGAIAQAGSDLDELMRITKLSELYDFGAWVEASRIAALSGKPSAIQVADVRHFRSSSQIQELPPGILLQLTEADRILSDTSDDREDLELLMGILEQIVLIMS